VGRSITKGKKKPPKWGGRRKKDQNPEYCDRGKKSTSDYVRVKKPIGGTQLGVNNTPSNTQKQGAVNGARRRWGQPGAFNPFPCCETGKGEGAKRMMKTIRWGGKEAPKRGRKKLVPPFRKGASPKHWGTAW